MTLQLVRLFCSCWSSYDIDICWYAGSMVEKTRRIHPPSLPRLHVSNVLPSRWGEIWVWLWGSLGVMPSNFYKVIDVPLGACAVYIYIFIYRVVLFCWCLHLFLIYMLMYKHIYVYFMYTYAPPTRSLMRAVRHPLANQQTKVSYQWGNCSSKSKKAWHYQVKFPWYTKATLKQYHQDAGGFIRINAGLGAHFVTL